MNHTFTSKDIMLFYTMVPIPALIALCTYHVILAVAPPVLRVAMTCT